MTAFLDTDVLIDCLRGVPIAQTWLASSASTQFQVSGIVAMELVMGCHSKPDLVKVKRFLKTFSVVWPDQTDFAYAYDLLTQHRFSSGLSIPDCVIAAQVLNHAEVLYSFNTKHFRIIAGLKVQQPYLRS